ncbi:hypothetical protein CPB86DRAFT_839110 [Serendipita vermifera]|nr:hypothetical protein CPB86DRAFT_839110 [Serendipita vermifera]
MGDRGERPSFFKRIFKRGSKNQPQASKSQIPTTSERTSTPTARNASLDARPVVNNPLISTAPPKPRSPVTTTTITSQNRDHTESDVTAQYHGPSSYNRRGYQYGSAAGAVGGAGFYGGYAVADGDGCGGGGGGGDGGGGDGGGDGEVAMEEEVVILLTDTSLWLFYEFITSALLIGGTPEGVLPRFNMDGRPFEIPRIDEFAN